MTLSIITLCKMALSIMAKNCYAKCQLCSIPFAQIITYKAFMVSVVSVSVILLCDIMLCGTRACENNLRYQPVKYNPQLRGLLEIIEHQFI